MRRAGDHLADDAVDLLQLAHQVRPACAAGRRCPRSATSKSRALAFSQASWATAAGSLPCGVLDDLAAEPLAPDGELLDGGGAEGVAGGDHDLLALVHDSCLASLAMDVVLPEPLTPATMTTVGPAVA